MIQTLTRNRWLLALCCAFQGAIAVLYFLMYETDGPLTFHSWHNVIAWEGRLALAAAACAIAAGMLGSGGKCWLLVANGVAMAALGLIQVAFVRYPIHFLTIAALVVLMAISLGILERLLAQAMRRERHMADGRILDLAAVASVVFALGFLALGLGWLRMGPGSHPDLLWLGSYFGFSAICMLELSLRLDGRAGETGGRGFPRVKHDPLSA